MNAPSPPPPPPPPRQERSGQMNQKRRGYHVSEPRQVKRLRPPHRGVIFPVFPVACFI